MSGANGQPPPAECVDCGKSAEYRVDAFGVRSEHGRCRDCHEDAVRRNVREDFRRRYGP
jgi:hypothetical protein